MKCIFKICIVLCIFTFTHCTYAKASTTQLHIAVAASLKPVFEEKIIPLYLKDKKNISIQGVYDSSGRLEIQIKEGLEVDLFFSAASVHIERLIQTKQIDIQNTAQILTNTLVLIQNNSIKEEKRIQRLEDITNLQYIAIANPKIAPIGAYAKEALEDAKLWKKIEKSLSLAQNVIEVIHWVGASSADAGIVYASDVKNAKNIAIVAEIPYDNSNLKYMLGILNSSKNKLIIQDFMEFIQGEEANKIFNEYGFLAL